MFSSPAIHVFSHENTETVPRKPGATTASRKPFIDRTINGTSPDMGRLKSEPQFKKPDAKLDRQLLSPKPKPCDDDLFFYDTCSFQEKDVDVLVLTQKDTLNILRSYWNYGTCKTPPPEFDLQLEMPEQDLNSSEDFGELSEESVEDVSLPELYLD